MSVLTNSEIIKERCDGLKKCEFITIDTEFLREKTYYPKLCLVQVSGPDKDAFAIDPLANGVDLSPLYDLLYNPKIIKVFHAARQDLEIFYNLTGKVPIPVFDTQIAASVCGYGDSAGYETLVNNITKKSIDKSSQFTDWSQRPLSDKQIHYALGDVTHLCDIYTHLKDSLEKRGRLEWVEQEDAVLSSPHTYKNDPYNSWKRIKIRSPKAKSLAILRELAAWREKQAQRRDIPKTWVMRDETLSEMAGQAPADKKQLQKIRNISSDLANGRTGEQLLKAISTALETPKDTWPEPKKKVQMSQNASAALDILKMLLKLQSAQHEVAAKIIAPVSDLEAIAMDDSADVPALKGWRFEIFGRDALALKKGELAIGIKDSKITKFKTNNL